ncbi:FAT-domain-containing protein [Cantharellus anzutake]|uniref:FAT-domain-containing protein n=1 Tax=Cantharellus anzutake TaxID=1750568 RepID=UPI0019062E1E|nr:FAT-domain-containing protein [Cantharellus anzutake]KAF8339104.1 FAT-domain-containing protein [Cantharellus anzutake]
MAIPPPQAPEFVHYIARLLDPSISQEVKRSIATELRDFHDFHRDPADVTRFISIALPMLIKFLRDGHPSFKKNSLEHQTRIIVLTTIQRFPHSENMKQHVVDIQNLMVHLLRNDNEDLGVICVKIVIDINRTYRALLEGHIQPFISWIIDLYEGMPAVVGSTFREGGGEGRGLGIGGSFGSTSAAGGPDADDQLILPVSLSFKVLVECPIATVLFSDPEQPNAKYSLQLVPASIKFLQLEVAQQKRAHEESAKENNMWIGVAPGIKNRAAYTDFITAQIKVMSYIAYVFRHPHEQFGQYAQVIPTVAVRLLQDCPAEASAIRKDLIIAIRHMLTEEIRTLFLAKLDSLMDERILIGPGVASREGLRPLAYTTLADLIHHVRAELSVEQLSRVFHAYSCILHDASIPCGTQTMSMKFLINLVEFVVAKCSRPGAARILMDFLETAVEKLEALHRVYEDQILMYDAQKSTDLPVPLLSFVAVERSKPTDALSYVLEPQDAVIKDSRLLFWTLQHGFKSILRSLREVEASPPDSELMGKLMEAGVKCLALYERWPVGQMEKDFLERFGEVFLEMAPPVVQEVWTLKFPFYMERLLEHPNILQLPQMLLANEAMSRPLLSIMLRYLVGQLDTLGEQDTKHAAATLRMFKMCFMAATLYPEQNEMVLLPHIPRLIVDSFPLAAKSPEPTHYYLLLRALFRAIGGHKFDNLYKEVLPLLQEMLENLNRLLLASVNNANIRDLISELCLTVPVKLTFLLPYLHHLMKPLVFALRAGPELVAQGLRTLELCIDNLTPEFLDPTLNPVLPNLMGALHNLLKPLPVNHMSAHVTIRILGKLGGRNRRLHYEPPRLEYRTQDDETSLLMSFDSRSERVDISALCGLAAKSIRHSNAVYRAHAYELLKTSLAVVLGKGNDGGQRDSVFSVILGGLFDAIHVPELMPHAHEYVRDMTCHIFITELGKMSPSSFGSRRTMFAPVISVQVEAITRCLTVSDPKDMEKARDCVSAIIEDLLRVAKEAALQEGQGKDVNAIIHLLASRFVGLCFEEAIECKMAGFNGIVIMIRTPQLEVGRVEEREIDFIRALLGIIKDTPPDTSRSISDITSTILDILRLCHGPRDDEHKLGVDDLNVAKQQTFLFVVSVMVSELSSANTTVRRTAQQSLELLAELTGKTTYDLVRPGRDRLLGPIFNRPLRALPLLNQIGHVDAVTYTLNMRPPLPEVTEELWRMLNETLAVADADDNSLNSQNRTGQMQNLAIITNLRVACIKLLSAAIPATDFFQGQNTMRARVITVYFKSLYLVSNKVKDAASDGLQTVLNHQSRLPKELLHGGLRPILLNLADPKKLILANLEGLARLLGLLTNHFKPEIGAKLIEHYKTIADPKMLNDAARNPLADNDEIGKLVRLADIFHRLPFPAGVVFLKDIAECIVQSETALLSASPTPFTQPLSAFVDKYPVESVEYFFSTMANDRHVRSFRNVLISNSAPAFLAQLRERTPFLISHCLRDADLLLPGLLVCLDLARLDIEWFCNKEDLIPSLLEVWNSELTADQNSQPRTKPVSTLLAIFQLCLEHRLNLSILFSLIAVYTHRIALELSALARFLHINVVLNAVMETKREIFIRFLDWFEKSSARYDYITFFLRVIISPMLVVSYQKPNEQESFITEEMVKALHVKVWKPMLDMAYSNHSLNDACIIELLHVSSLLIQHCPDLLNEARGDIQKFAWAFVTSEDAIVKQTANLLTARAIKAYPGSPSLARKVWVGLLKPQMQNEGRNLIRQAVDTLAPALPTRASEPSKEGSNIPLWAMSTRIVLQEEGNSLSSMVSIYRIIMRHSELFYPYREQFVAPMINSLPKLGLGPGGGMETRLMTLEVVDHILRWERQRVKFSDVSEANDNNGDVHMASPSDSWTIPLQLRESCVAFLVRLVMSVGADASGKPQIVLRALRTLRELLAVPGWSDATIKPAFFERTLVQSETTPEALPHTTNALRLLAVSIDDKPEEWILANLKNSRTWLEKPLSRSEAAIHEIAIPIMDKIITSMSITPDDPPPDLSDQRGLEEPRSAAHLPLVLNVLLFLVRKIPSALKDFATSLMKLFTKACREHTNPSPDKKPIDVTSRLIKNMLEISRIQAPVSSEARKSLIASIILLVDKSTDISICRLILNICREWVFDRQDPIPTMREKATILQKMAAFEHKRDEALFVDYLNLIYDIYKEPSLHRTDLTTKLEPAFLIGLRYKDPALRSKFAVLFDESLPRSLSQRMQYALGSQSWEYLADHYWIPQALDLLLGAVNENEVILGSIHDIDMDDNDNPSFGARVTTIGDFVRPARQLLPLDPETAHLTWVSVFGAIWRLMSRKEQADVARSLTILLGKEYHLRQARAPRNVVQSLLAGAAACRPPLALPPFVVKYLGKTFNAWHIALEILQSSLNHIREDEAVRDATLDALAELYAELSEDDMFYGLWRRRALYPETNIAVSFEQNGLWADAQSMYESAQTRARQGSAPFSESEYCLWEDHWILSAQKLQQWETLKELATAEGNHDLVLECAWRLSDWTANSGDRDAIDRAMHAVQDVHTPRRRVFETYAHLIRSNPSHSPNDRNEFVRMVEESMQIALRKWVSLPSIISMVHVPLLQHFQQLVELQEAAQIFHALTSTTASNLEKRSADLKMILQAWRERLPNLYDDISVWSDLVAWRQHVFSRINHHFLPLIPQPPPNQGVSGNSGTAGYRGFHETAWIINRFAHVARKHGLLEVCHNSLGKIYTLPNIEISEAFLKLREQARCHYQVSNELQAGLEVINNTNLVYFTPPQKAEFFTLKGMFIAKLGHNEEANAAFGQAVQMDLNMPKAWAEWGKYNDRMFKEQPGELALAGNAVSCYLQAAGLYKNSKTRPLLIRILWFLSVDEIPGGPISKAFESFKGDMALWYWITLIPQLLLSLSHREARHARRLLMELAKTYPQALFFQLRTVREDYAQMKKQVTNASALAAAAVARAESANTAVAANPASMGKPSEPSETLASDTQKTTPGESPAELKRNGEDVKPVANQSLPGSAPENAPVKVGSRHPWEYVDEISAILKTAYPLLAPTLEQMVDQLGHRFKPTQEEEIYRFISALLSEGVYQSVQRNGTPGDDGSVPDVCVTNIVRLAASLPPATKQSFEEDLVKSKPTMKEYVERLQIWRDRYESHLEARPRIQPLNVISHWLVEFQHLKYDDVEIPGQYLEHKDSSSDFIKIARFSPTFELCRGNSFCFRRITFIGHDGSRHPFAVQLPSARVCRREERFMQLFRIFNSVLARRKESRKRILTFHIPIAVPMTPSLRLLENDSSYVTLQDIYDQHCQTVGISREEPIITSSLKIKSFIDPHKPFTPAELTNLKMELMDELVNKMVPRTILSNYMSRIMAGPMERWMMRKQFTLQVAAVSFMSYVMSGGNRVPSRLHVSRKSGLIYSSELLPTHNTPVLQSSEAVPFRFTPNMQHFVTPNGIEGLMTSGIMAIGRCLTEPEYDLEQQLSLFLRDEVLTWYSHHGKQPSADIVFRTHVSQNVDVVVKRAEVLACKYERENTHPNSSIPASKAVSDLISISTNPQNLARMPEQWYPCY